MQRSQQTDLVEFYAIEINGKGRHRRAKEPGEIASRLAEWERFYNEVHPHSGIGRKPPRKRWEEVSALTPTRAEIDARYDPARETSTVKRGTWYTSRSETVSPIFTYGAALIGSGESTPMQDADAEPVSEAMPKKCILRRTFRPSGADVRKAPRTGSGSVAQPSSRGP